MKWSHEDGSEIRIRDIGLATLIIAAYLVLLAWSGSEAGYREITVSAAMSLKAPFEELGKIYERKKGGTRVSFNFGASGALQKQIEAGAPVDVFASASLKEMDELEGKGLIVKNTRSFFAGNSLVLVCASGAKPVLKSFKDLQKAEIKKIAIGNPKTVPAGKYSEEALKRLALWVPINDKLIFAENVRQVADYVRRKEVDAGMIFLSDVKAAGSEVRVAAEAPVGSHEPVIYAISVLKDARDQSPAKEFISLVMSEEGKKVLQKYGFTMIGKAESVWITLHYSP